MMKYLAWKTKIKNITQRIERLESLGKRPKRVLHLKKARERMLKKKAAALTALTEMINDLQAAKDSSDQAPLFQPPGPLIRLIPLDDTEG